MDNVRIDIDYEVISYSFVMIWSNPIPFIPTLDQEFAKGLFNKPNETAYVFNNSGLNISLHPLRQANITEPMEFIAVPPGVYPEIRFNPQLYANFNSSLQNVLGVHDSLIKEFDKIDQTFLKSLVVSQIGVNLELEVNIGKEFDSTVWTKKQLFGNEEPLLNNFLLNEYKFTLEEDVSKRTTIIFQPRIDNKNALYLAVNDHYGVSPIDSFSSVNSLKELVDVSLSKIDNLIYATLSNYIKQ